MNIAPPVRHTNNDGEACAGEKCNWQGQNGGFAQVQNRRFRGKTDLGHYNPVSETARCQIKDTIKSQYERLSGCLVSGTALAAGYDAGYDGAIPMTRTGG